MGAGGRRVLGALGLVAVGAGIVWGSAGAILAALGGAVFALTIGSWRRGARPPVPTHRPYDFHHTLDLLRRAHGARLAWAVGLQDGNVSVTAPGTIDAAVQERGAALVGLASVDGRAHVAREDAGTFVAVGDFPYGAGVLLAESDASPEVADELVRELRRFVATMWLAEMAPAEAPGARVVRQLKIAAAGAQTLQGIARAGADLAERLSQRAAAIAVPGSGHGVRIVAISPAADRRLDGLALSSASPVCHAIDQSVPVVTPPGTDVFGPGAPERRRRERAGSVYPLMDGNVVVGALVLVGAPIAPEGPVAEQVGRLVIELGPRVAAARSVHEAERLAVSDPLTGLNNRREFERSLNAFAQAGTAMPAALIYADLDHFKRLNDSLGHAAGDAALRHVATILQSHIRGGDMVARIGGEEFAVWLPGAPLGDAWDVAERIRRSIEQTTWRWNGNPCALSISCGVAGYPEGVGDVLNLPTAADAALYKAKQAGRNRVEKAGAGV